MVEKSEMWKRRVIVVKVNYGEGSGGEMENE
jgi:hypothetical protein